MKVWVYDIECYRNLFLVVFMDTLSDEIRIFKIYRDIDERKELKKFLETEVKGLIGYNNLNYDSQLIEYIYRNPDFTLQELKNYSDIIINSEERFPDVPEWNLRIPNLDLYRLHHYDNVNKRTSLKWLEYSMDMVNIEDLPSDGNGETWLEKVTEYCINDVNATKELYKRSRKEIALRKELKKKYGLNCLNWSNSKIGSELCLALYCKATRKQKSDVKSLRSYRREVALKDIIFDYISFQSDELNNVLNKFKSLCVRNIKSEIEFSQIYKNFQFDYGAGGIHGSVKNKVIKSDNEHVIVDCDVASLYPSIAIVNKLYPEHLGPEFCEVYEKDIVAVRLAEKAKKENGDVTIIDSFKEAANSVFGKSNCKYSWLYDVKYTLSTTINGQLMLSMLAEKLLNIDGLQLIQINTDGLTVRLNKELLKAYFDICKEWENLTNLKLEYAEYSKMIIRDVNNYIAAYTNGKTKCKGAFEFENIPLHKNKSYSIIPKAVYEYFVNNKPVEETIYGHKNIFDFCAGVRAKKTDKKGKSWFELRSIDGYALKREKLSKTVRYFVSNKGKHLFKCYEDGTYAHVEAPLNIGKMNKDWKITYFNKAYFPKDFSEYDINYKYYLHKAKEIITELEGDKSQLRMF